MIFILDMYMDNIVLHGLDKYEISSFQSLFASKNNGLEKKAKHRFI